MCVISEANDDDQEDDGCKDDARPNTKYIL